MAKFKCDEPTVTEKLKNLPASVIPPDIHTLEKLITDSASLRRTDSPEDFFRLYSAVFSVLGETIALFRDNKPVIYTDTIPYTDNIVKAKEYIDTHYNEKILLETLSQKAFLSKNFFRIKFREIIGVSPHEYLSKVRLSKVKELLRTTDKSIGEIAFSCGFESQAYLNYSFKRETGVSPLAYRKNSRSND